MDDVPGPNEMEPKATIMLEFLIEEAPAKIRTGPPLDDEEVYSPPHWAGVLPLAPKTGKAVTGFPIGDRFRCAGIYPGISASIRAWDEVSL